MWVAPKVEQFQVENVVTSNNTPVNILKFIATLEYPAFEYLHSMTSSAVAAVALRIAALI